MINNQPQNNQNIQNSSQSYGRLDPPPYAPSQGLYGAYQGPSTASPPPAVPMPMQQFGVPAPWDQNQLFPEVSTPKPVYVPQPEAPVFWDVGPNMIIAPVLLHDGRTVYQQLVRRNARAGDLLLRLGYLGTPFSLWAGFNGREQELMPGECIIKMLEWSLWRGGCQLLIGKQSVAHYWALKVFRPQPQTCRY